jgi:hypothetical protein
MKVYEYLGFTDKWMDDTFLKLIDIMFKNNGSDYTYGIMAKNLFNYIKENNNNNDDILWALILSTIGLFTHIGLFTQANEATELLLTLKREDK